MRQTGSRRSMVAHMYDKVDRAGRLNYITDDMRDDDPNSDHWQNAADKYRQLLIALIGFDAYAAYTLAAYPDHPISHRHEADLLKRGLVAAGIVGHEPDKMAELANK